MHPHSYACRVRMLRGGEVLDMFGHGVVVITMAERWVEVDTWAGMAAGEILENVW